MGASFTSLGFLVGADAMGVPCLVEGPVTEASVVIFVVAGEVSCDEGEVGISSGFSRL